MKDAPRPLSLSHEYQLVFLESADFSTNQFVLKTGIILGETTVDLDTLALVGNVNLAPMQTLFEVPFTAANFRFHAEASTLLHSRP
jgi:Glycoside hydrolase 131 catalytic N-terminal domain